MALLMTKLIIKLINTWIKEKYSQATKLPNIIKLIKKF